MKTEDLIAFLARGAEPQKPKHWGRRLALVLGGGLIIAVALVATVGFREDLGIAFWPVALKALFSAAAAVAVLPLMLRLMRPGAPLGWRIFAAFGFLVFAALLTIVSLMGAPESERMHAWTGIGFSGCLSNIPLLALPVAAGLIWFARGLAPTRLAITGAAIGALSGSIGAMAYAMYCATDSVAFVATWYAVAIALCAAMGALIGSIFLRW